MTVAAQPDLFLGDATDSRGEFAPTPPWVIRPALDVVRWTKRGQNTPIIHRVLDAGAGIGALGMAVEAYSCALHRVRPSIVAVEREADRCALLPDHWTQVCADFPEWANDRAIRNEPGFDLVVCNPPFSQWLLWTQLCLRMASDFGQVIMVGPVEYLSGVERGGWLHKNPPRYIHIHCKRPRGQGWDDTRGILTMTWRKGAKGPTETAWVP